MNRRGFLASILAAGVAPYVSMASGVLMPGRGTIIVPSNRIMTPAEFTREALSILEKNIVFRQAPISVREYKALYNDIEVVSPPLRTPLPSGIEEIKW